MSFGDDLDRQRAQIMRAVRHASDDWAAAMRAHKLAPPDAGFASRLRDLAEAASNEQVAWEHAHAAGLLWRPVPGAENAAPPYELRPGTGRRGPAPLWERFDTAVATLNHAITGSSAAAGGRRVRRVRGGRRERWPTRSRPRTRRHGHALADARRRLTRLTSRTTPPSHRAHDPPGGAPNHVCARPPSQCATN